MSRVITDAKWAERDALMLRIKQQTAPLHFIERVKERYGIDMSLDEYYELLASGAYLGHYRKSSQTSVGVVPFKGVDIWCMYSSKNKLFLTALPAKVGTESRSMVEAVFSRSLRAMAMTIHDHIMNELKTERVDFDSCRDAALYYFSNTRFPRLLMYRFKFGNLPNRLICSEVNRIIRGDHKFAKIALEKKPRVTIDHESSYQEHEDSSE